MKTTKDLPHFIKKKHNTLTAKNRGRKLSEKNSNCILFFTNICIRIQKIKRFLAIVKSDRL